MARITSTSFRDELVAEDPLARSHRAILQRRGARRRATPPVEIRDYGETRTREDRGQVRSVDPSSAARQNP
jgi:hypothetical protein